MMGSGWARKDAKDAEKGATWEWDEAGNAIGARGTHHVRLIMITV